MGVAVRSGVPTRTPAPGIWTGCGVGFVLPGLMAGGATTGAVCGLGVPGPLGLCVDDGADIRAVADAADKGTGVGSGAGIGVEAAGDDCCVGAWDCTSI